MRFFKPVRFVKSTAKAFVDFPSWLGIRYLKEATASIVDMTKPLFYRDKITAKETFEQAISRLGLTEHDLILKSQGLWRQLIIYSIVAGFALLYMLFLLAAARFFLAIIMMMIVALLVCKAYRAHYYYYCIQSRKLGVTFKDWWQNIIGRGGKK